LKAGADKVSINSAAIKNPGIIFEASAAFGKEAVVIAIDGKKMDDGGYGVYINGGKTYGGLDAVEWAVKAEALGAGEILLTSMDADGTNNGFDIELLQAVCEAVNIPVVASGGCGELAHFTEVFQKTAVDAALAASVFHYGKLTIGQVKKELRKNNIPVKQMNGEK